MRISGQATSRLRRAWVDSCLRFSDPRLSMRPLSNSSRSILQNGTLLNYSGAPAINHYRHRVARPDPPKGRLLAHVLS